ncbi:MAG: MotA/TolQ/ExbB proton channel family protein [Sterolibacterium sp.]|nr:MotA/TolQ/ExbB proton channel family protein [Sterolibacterium sp.]
MLFIKCIQKLLIAAALIWVPLVTAMVTLQPAPAIAQATEPSKFDETKPAEATGATQETVDNPYGLKAMWQHGDWVSKGTLFILTFMSIGTWYILVIKLFEQFRLMREGNEVSASFWTSGSLQKSIETLKNESAYRFIAEKGLDSTVHHEGLLGDVDLDSWVTKALNRAANNVQARMQDGLSFLATVGSTAPFVGLFGTVWGIYHALTAIGIAGQASIDKVAGPVGEALIMTAFGLAVAVPAVLAYNWLIRRNKLVMENVRAFSDDLHSVLLSKKQ